MAECIINVSNSSAVHKHQPVFPFLEIVWPQRGVRVERVLSACARLALRFAGASMHCWHPVFDLEGPIDIAHWLVSIACASLKIIAHWLVWCVQLDRKRVRIVLLWALTY